MTNSSEPLSNNTFILNNLKNSNQLPIDELDNLILKAQRGDIRAINQVCTSYLRYIYSLVKKYARPNYPIEDLFDDGVVGLLESIKSYDPHKGSFTTHVMPWVMKHIWKSIRKETSNTEFLNELLAYNEDIESDPYHPFIGTDSGKLDIESRILRHELDNVLSKYTDEEQSYLASYWGLHDLEPLSIPKIAKKNGVSYSRVQRTLYNLTDKLRRDEAVKSLWEDYQAVA